MNTVTTLAAVGTALLFLISLVLFAWTIWKRALLEVQSKALDEQAKAIEAYADRVKQLEETVKDRDRTIENMQRKLAELETRSYDDRELVKTILEAIAGTNVCLDAAGCINRVVPTV